jgi:hypothetical protein
MIAPNQRSLEKFRGVRYGGDWAKAVVFYANRFDPVFALEFDVRKSEFQICDNLTPSSILTVSWLITGKEAEKQRVVYLRLSLLFKVSAMGCRDVVSTSAASRGQERRERSLQLRDNFTGVLPDSGARIMWCSIMVRSFEGRCVYSSGRGPDRRSRATGHRAGRMSESSPQLSGHAPESIHPASKRGSFEFCAGANSGTALS